MIYCVIFDTKKRENNIRKKNDCRILRQSILTLPSNIEEYVNEAGNPLVKSERLGAYSSLLASLKCFYNIEDPVIIHQNGKKPHITSQEIFFNISHSDGVTVVTLSDECDVGVDIQSEPDEVMKARLKKRFLSNYSPINEDIGITYFLAEQNSSDFIFYEAEAESAGSNFASDWTSMEAVMKLYGDGFSSLSNINDLANKSKIEASKINIDKTEYYIANAIKNG